MPLGRVGGCENGIGRAAVYLASEDAGCVVGNALRVDRGVGTTR